ncbi:type II toxin-antitoxin system HipA family toxin (plasmid) [Parasedimentitalea marina]|uniref:Type II toxin-antitoxin system HipA family toxin n=1 Tax=Parasedimentitalea marina TaxID=2483033 RepID=A0A3T0NA94_9RHOB|nr:HipA domain-containing protein [Parasedimentitalea marina]AZV80948.1 type II toxin-antitoxin system HipA family toxin [Parasedimentitalea marina]
MLTVDVHIEGVEAPVGKLVRLDDGSTSFRYLRDDLPHPVSLSLPVQDQPFKDKETRGFFSNLLFENEMLEQVIRRHGVERTDFVGLLFHLGADCPGAISCGPEGEGAPKAPGILSADYEPVSDEGLVEIITSLRDHRRLPTGQVDPSPLAGVQGKVALARLPDGSFALPKSGRRVPTTHILKVPRLIKMSEVQQEYMAMEAMMAFQEHPVAACEVIGDGDLQALLIERFDRIVHNDKVSRIHQEDFCQALGLSADLKYQRKANGQIPRFDAHAIGGIIAKTAQPGVARLAMLKITLANLLLGNTDNHAKNHALLYRGFNPELAPIYDVVPTIIDPEVTHEMSFRIGAAQMTDEITGDDLDVFARELGMRSFTKAHQRMVCGMVAKAIDMMKDMRGPVKKRFRDVLAEQGKHLKAAADCGVEIPDGDLIVINRP